MLIMLIMSIFMALELLNIQNYKSKGQLLDVYYCSKFTPVRSRTIKNKKIYVFHMDVKVALLRAHF